MEKIRQDKLKQERAKNKKIKQTKITIQQKNYIYKKKRTKRRILLFFSKYNLLISSGSKNEN